jgi:hypothetical protein
LADLGSHPKNSATVPIRASLETRFTRFLTDQPGAEAIDTLEWPKDPERRRKADFLLANRQVIVELKTLVEDPLHKIESIADKHRNRDDWPLFYGTADVGKVLGNLSDGESIYGKMVNALGRSVEAALRSAEEQVTDTRHVLNLPNAASLLVIMNDSVDVLDPYLVGHRVAQLMRRPRTGKSSAGNLDFVWLLFESHTAGVMQDRPAVICPLIVGESKNKFPWFSAFHGDLVQRWATANGGIAVTANVLDLSKVRFAPMSRTATPAPTQLPRQEVWRREYQARPHFRSLSNEQLLTRGSDIIRKMKLHFVEKRPEDLSNVVGSFMEEFTHFLEEMNFRGLDMRRIPTPR